MNESYTACGPGWQSMAMMFVGGLLLINAILMWCEALSKKQKIHRISISLICFKIIFATLFVWLPYYMLYVFSMILVYFPIDMVIILLVGKIRNTIIGFKNKELIDMKISKLEEKLSKLKTGPREKKNHVGKLVKTPNISPRIWVEGDPDYLVDTGKINFHDE